MVKLDYRTNNPRWGLRGVVFSDWQSCSFILGYLSNPAHNIELNPRLHSADISIRIERNDKLGAWSKEGRIHFYGSNLKLQQTLTDLYYCSIDGVGRITKRIDSNGYIRSLIEDYQFEVCPRIGNATADIFPPNISTVETLLEKYLSELDITDENIDECLECFRSGFEV